MELQSNVVIVSVYGRGQWLSAELARRGLKVTLLDISEQLGRWTPDDWEGPFGFFRTEKLRPMQLERLLEDDAPEMCVNGFTIWLRSGPLEMQGPMYRHRLEKLNYEVSHLKTLSEKINSSVHEEQPLKTQRPQNLTESFSIRQASRPGYERSLDWCEASGVQVIAKARVKDISLGDRNSMTGVEIQATQSGLLKADQFVWMLSSEETHYISKKISQVLFPKGYLEPEWCWVRYRVRMSACLERDALPIHVVIVENEDFSWTHENLLILQKTFSSDQFDLWMKVPSSQRFQKQYLVDLSKKFLQILQGRMPSVMIEVLDYPQEYNYTFEELGASRFPVFSEKQKQKFYKRDFRNTHFDGPEFWQNLGWNGQMLHQDLIEDNLMKWWKKLLELKEKNRD